MYWTWCYLSILIKNELDYNLIHFLLIVQGRIILWWSK